MRVQKITLLQGYVGHRRKKCVSFPLSSVPAFLSIKLLPSQYGPCPLSHLIFIGMQCNFECKMLIIAGTKTYLPDEDDDQILDAERINLYQQMTGCIMYCSLVRPELM